MHAVAETNASRSGVSPSPSSRVALQQSCSDQPAGFLDAATEADLIDRWRATGDARAVDRLVRSYQPLVARMALRFKTSGVPMVDLMAQGNLGLMNALHRFDPERGFRLSTYAVWWIRAAIGELLNDHPSAPRYVAANEDETACHESAEAEAALPLSENGPHAPTSPGTGEASGRTPPPPRRRALRDLSLNDPVFSEEDNGGTWQDLLADPANDQETTLIHTDELAKRRLILAEVIATLEPRERRVIEDRFLLEEPMTLAEIGDRYGVTRERVRQIEAKAYATLAKRMKQAALARGLITPAALATRDPMGLAVSDEPKKRRRAKRRQPANDNQSSGQ